MGPLTCVSNRLGDWSGVSGSDRDLLAARTTEAIALLEPEIKAFVPGSLDVSAVQRTSEGDPDAPFAGAPVAIKEIIAVKNMSRRAGSTLPPEAFSPREASIVARLRALGLVPIGHAVSTEFAYFHPGPTRNPRNTAHTPGGSSSGSAAAVAAGMCPVAVGTQTIGSVIRPASFCGIVGYKPSFGHLARDGVYPVSRTVDHLGFFSQDLDGMQRLAATLACPGLAPQTRSEGTSEHRALEVRVCGGPYVEQGDATIIRALAVVADALRHAGASITIDPIFSNIGRINTHHRRIMARDFFHAHAALFRAWGDRYRAQSRELYEEGAAVSVEDYEQSLAERESEIATFDEASAHGTRPIVWLSPAAAGAAPTGLESTGSPLLNLPWTHVGAPVLTLPMALDEASGLPLGLQIAAPRGRDDLVFAAARLVAATVGDGAVR